MVVVVNKVGFDVVYGIGYFLIVFVFGLFDVGIVIFM